MAPKSLHRIRKNACACYNKKDWKRGKDENKKKETDHMGSNNFVVLVAAAVGAVQFKRIPEQKMAEKNAVQKVKSVDDLAGRKIGVQIGTTGDTIQRIMPRKIKVPR